MGRPKNFSREGVLERALPVFWKHGFGDTSLQDLEKATGVNKSGLYAEFADKGDLYLESLRHYLRKRQKEDLLTAHPPGWENIERFPEARALQLGGSEGLLLDQFHEPVRCASPCGARGRFQKLRWSQRSDREKRRSRET